MSTRLRRHTGWRRSSPTLKAARGRALVHVGPDQPAETHALAHAMNEALGARGPTFDLIEPVVHEPVDQAGSLRALIAAMQAGQVTNLLILDSNPVFTAPATLGLRQALKQVPFSLTLAGNADETAAVDHLVRAPGP